MEDLNATIRGLEGKLGEVEAVLSGYRQQIASLQGPKGRQIVKGPLRMLEALRVRYEEQLRGARAARDALLRGQQGGNNSRSPLGDGSSEQRYREEVKRYKGMMEEMAREVKELKRQVEKELRKYSPALLEEAERMRGRVVYTGQRGGRYILVPMEGGGEKRVYVRR